MNRITDTGAKVLLATIIDVGVTPFGIAERNGHADTDRAALLTPPHGALQRRRCAATIVNDGRVIGLVLLDELVSAIAQVPRPRRLHQRHRAASAT